MRHSGSDTVATGMFVLAMVLCTATVAAAQSPAAPANGNRANGFSYQPTPGQVLPREKTAGVQAPATTQQRTNHDLERTDKRLLRDEGLSAKSVPNLSNHQ